MKIRPVGAELFHTDGQTDITKRTVSFRNFFSNAPVLRSALFVPGKHCYHSTGDKFFQELLPSVVDIVLRSVSCRSQSLQFVGVVAWTIGESEFDSRGEA